MTQPLPQPLPLDEFMRLLGETPKNWELIPNWRMNQEHVLRTVKSAASAGCRMCPITAVAKHHFGMIYPNLDALGAARAIGLSTNDAQLVIRAADGRDDVMGVRGLLVGACAPTVVEAEPEEWFID